MRKSEEQIEYREGWGKQPSTSKLARNFTSINPDMPLPNYGGAIGNIGKIFSLNSIANSGNILVPIVKGVGSTTLQFALSNISPVGIKSFVSGWALGSTKFRKTEKIFQKTESDFVSKSLF